MNRLCSAQECEDLAQEGREALKIGGTVVVRTFSLSYLIPQLGGQLLEDRSSVSFGDSLSVHVQDKTKRVELK